MDDTAVVPTLVPGRTGLLLDHEHAPFACANKNFTRNG